LSVCKRNQDSQHFILSSAAPKFEGIQEGTKKESRTPERMLAIYRCKYIGGCSKHVHEKMTPALKDEMYCTN
jgi:hypothetical protein